MVTAFTESVRSCIAAARFAPTRGASWGAAVFVSLAVVMSLGGCHSSSTPSSSTDGGSHPDVPGGNADGAASDAGGGGGGGGIIDGNCTTVGATGTTPKSLPCGCNNECETGFCVDGVCCESACTDKCKSCALPSSRGQCALIPSGLKPTDPRECVPADPSTCGFDGTCDGTGNCGLYDANTPCKGGTCAGSGISGLFACDGNGACGAAPATSCFPFSCDPATNLCGSSCSTNAQCAENQVCTTNSCGKSMNGAVCKVDDDCQSGFCTDGVCCNVACAGPCMACNLPSSKGRCDLIGAGKPDPAFCQVTSYTTCDTTGSCDGYGGCSIYPANTLCGPAACAGDTALNLPPACDGQGTCQDPDLVDCGAYRCANGACNTTCKGDADCAPTRPCVNGVCIGDKLQNGQKCTGTGDQCGSGNCVDGVCCESACTGACRSCGLPGSLGRCVNAAAGAADPHATCTDMGKPSCATDGLCDGTGACEKYPVDTECSSESCSGGAYTPASKCNASGQCVTPTSRSCNPYQCSGKKCASTCTPTNEGTQCLPPNSCVNGACGKQPVGADCGGGSECQSGFCAQGVCCNSACKGACMACNLSGSTGICTAVPDGKPDPQNICAATSSSSCGTTGMCKGGACAFWASGQNCKAAKCVTPALTSVTPTSTCDGKGTCVTPANKSCGTFQCDSSRNSCKTSCTVASQTADCVGSNTCSSNGSCGLKPNSASCTSNAQCSSGSCTEGVCCNSACTDAAGSSGLCMSCKVSGKVGTCSPVGSGGADPRGRCTATNPSPATGVGNCANDGTCNGAGACRAWSTATGCRRASCTGTTFTPAANCDGKGTCAASAPSSCNPFVCSATSPSCLTTCTKDTDCSGGLTCLKTTNRCGNTLPQGSSCVVNNDCTTNICNSEKVCCNSACAGACQSCTLTGKVGTCSSISAGGTPRDTVTCAATPGNVCGNTTKCDGNGGCQLANAGLVCGAATCAPAVSGVVGGVAMSESLALIPARTCNGVGACITPAAVSCGAYQCNASASPDTCKTTCTATNTDCNALAPPAGSGNSCTGGICQKKANGAVCGAGSECVNGACVDDGSGRTICCATACTAQADVCGTSGFCATNGSSCAKKLTPATPCAPATCVPGTTGVSAKTCSTTGTCTLGGGARCAAGQLCNSAGVCAVPLLATGTACTTDAQCLTNHCVSTSATAKVCSVTACTNTITATAPCGTTGLVDSTGMTCVRNVGTMCLASTCTVGTTGTTAKTCGSDGTCSAGGTAPFCPTGQTCNSAGTCRTPLGPGKTCVLDTDCASNHCLMSTAGKVCSANACVAKAPSAPCGNTGAVDPTGTTCVTNAGAQCAAATCDNLGRGVAAKVCTTAGVCPTANVAICPVGQVCSGTGPMFTCVTPLLPTNSPCSANGDCLSNVCIDSVAAGSGKICCSMACTADTSINGCGNTGQCAIGGLTCAKKPATTVCGDPAIANCISGAKKCDGGGMCATGTRLACPGMTMCNSSSGACDPIPGTGGRSGTGGAMGTGGTVGTGGATGTGGAPSTSVGAGGR